jgi:hypothetical protein
MLCKVRKHTPLCRTMVKGFLKYWRFGFEMIYKFNNETIQRSYGKKTHKSSNIEEKEWVEKHTSQAICKHHPKVWRTGMRQKLNVDVVWCDYDFFAYPLVSFFTIELFH